MRIEESTKLDFTDVLIRPKRSTLTSRKDVELERSFTFLHSGRTWSGIPIIAANMASSGTFEMAKALSQHKIITALHKFYSVAELTKFFSTFHQPDYVAYTLGIRDEDFAKIEVIKAKGLEKHFHFLVLDVPNAYLERFVGALQKLRKMFPTHTIIAGNVVTNEMTEELILKGADIVKIGIGSGAACTTRRKTGVGYPQLSAVIECSDAAHGITLQNSGNGCIVSDGGIVYPSDIAKAFCGGADFVMLGTALAGFKQSGGKVVKKNGRVFKEHFGMSSNAAMKTFYGKVDAHRTSEGRETLLPFKGDVHLYVQDILGGLRSTATYIGARKLKEFSRRATFLRVNNQLNTSVAEFDTKKS